MKAFVYVTLKSGVLDPQGKAICHSAELIGYRNIRDIRQGKFFEIDFDVSETELNARTSAERLAKDVLANPVIEDYRIEIGDS